MKAYSKENKELWLTPRLGKVSKTGKIERLPDSYNNAAMHIEFMLAGFEANKDSSLKIDNKTSIDSAGWLAVALEAQAKTDSTVVLLYPSNEVVKTDGFEGKQKDSALYNVPTSQITVKAIWDMAVLLTSYGKELQPVNDKYQASAKALPKVNVMASIPEYKKDGTSAGKRTRTASGIASITF